VNHKSFFEVNYVRMSLLRKLFLVNGFLGSGKTTVITNACKILIKNQVRAGIIFNDQGDQLVDSLFGEGEGVPSGQVINGCFCCNYNQFMISIANLEKNFQPEILFAESVGSCTDLVATVIKPLQKSGSHVDLVITVVADATMLPVLLKGSVIFDKNVTYIYHKQLEEADIILVTKTDLLPEGTLPGIKNDFIGRYPDKQFLFINSFNNNDLEQWLEMLANHNKSTKRKSLDIDYDAYGAGEAALAWFDQELEIKAREKNAWEIAVSLINRIYSAINNEKPGIGHLKFYLEDPESPLKISFTTMSRSIYSDHLLPMQKQTQKLLINARVQTSPELLETIITEATCWIKDLYQCDINAGDTRSFQPGFPTPVHRIEH